jgi:hypothetical protein
MGVKHSPRDLRGAGPGSGNERERQRLALFLEGRTRAEGNEADGGRARGKTSSRTRAALPEEQYLCPRSQEEFASEPKVGNAEAARIIFERNSKGKERSEKERGECSLLSLVGRRCSNRDLLAPALGLYLLTSTSRKDTGEIVASAAPRDRLERRPRRAVAGGRVVGSLVRAGANVAVKRLHVAGGGCLRLRAIRRRRFFLLLSLPPGISEEENLKMKQAATGGELKSERQSPEFFFFSCCLGKRWCSPSFGFFEFGIEKGGDLARSPPLSSLPGRRIVFASHRDTTAGRA